MKIGPFEILEELDSRGTGIVYRARQEPLGREVALKLPRRPPEPTVEALRRFRREMRILAGLSSPRVVQVYDGVFEKDLTYIVMELVPGEDIGQALARAGRFPWPFALAVAIRVLDGLAHLHDQEIIHRDIRPSHVRISRKGEVKIVDLGLARGREHTLLTAAGATIGVLPYAAPELLVHSEGSPAADIWSVGCVTYEMLTGSPPVEAGSLKAWEARIRKPIPDPSLKADLPPEVARAVLGFLALDPGKRPPSAREAGGILESLLRDLSGHTLESILEEGCLDRSRPGSPSPGRPSARLGPPPEIPPPRPESRNVTQWMSPVLILLATALAGFFASRWFHQPLVGGSGAKILTSPAGDPPVKEPGSGGAVELRISFTARWKDFYGILPDLVPRSPRAAAAVTRLRRGFAPLDLGTEPGVWKNFLEMNRWLTLDPHPQDPPTIPPFTGMGLVDLEQALIFDAFPQEGLLRERLSKAFRMTGFWGYDVRSWIALATSLREDGREREAREACSVALRRAKSGMLRDARRFYWVGLGRALIQTPGSDVVKEITRLLRELPDRQEPFAGLAYILAGDHAAHYEAILRNLLDHPALGPRAYRELGRWIGARSGHAFEGQHMLEDGLKRHPASSVLTAALAEFFIERGYFEEAQGLTESAVDYGVRPVHRWILTTVEDPAREPLRPEKMGLRLWDEARVVEEMRCARDIGQGKAADAVRRFGEKGLPPWIRFSESYRMGMELQASSDPEEFIDVIVQNHLLSGAFDIEKWIFAMGTASREPATSRILPLLDALEERVRAPPPAPNPDRPALSPDQSLLSPAAPPTARTCSFLRALLASRRRQFETSVTSTLELLRTGPLPRAEAFEILRRPCWYARADPAAAAAAKRVVENLPAIPGEISSRLRSSSEVSPEAWSRDAILEFAGAPDRPVWGLDLVFGLGEIERGAGPGTRVPAPGDSMQLDESERSRWSRRVLRAFQVNRTGLWSLAECRSLTGIK